MATKIIGIDPGLTGAMSVLVDGELVAVHDLPTFEVGVGVRGSATKRKKRRKIDINGLMALLKPHQDADCAWLEEVSAMPGMHVVSMFNFGKTAGMIEACVINSKIPLNFVRPNIWKKALGVPADKDSCRVRASELLPGGYPHWQRKKDHNRAESALIAHYGAQNG